MTEAPTTVANLCRERYAAGLDELVVCNPRRRDILETLRSIWLEGEPRWCSRFVRGTYVIKTQA